MSNVAKLKKKAVELEQKRQFDKALAVYVQILQSARGSAEDADVALYNRVGDLYMRQGNTNEALSYYERAVDLYADGGYFNNAIALCNKILRQSPGRTVIYYKLGKISAQKGFKSDAKASFLEYAGRMQRAGQLDEAFRALREFADLSPDQEDIRVLLAEQLSKNGRKDQALEQLQHLFDKYSSEGRSDEARATQARMQALDSTAQPRANATPLRNQAQDLVFLDLDSDGDSTPAVGQGSAAATPEAPPARRTPLSHTAPGGVDSLPFLDLDEDDPPARPPAVTLDAPAFEPAAPANGDDGAPSVQGVEGFEGTAVGAVPAGSATPLDLPASDFTADFAPPTLSVADFAQHVEEADDADDQALPLPAHDLVLPGELPPVESLAAPLPAVEGLDLYLPTGFDLAPSPELPDTPAALEIDTEATLQPTPYRGLDTIPFDLVPAAAEAGTVTDLPLIDLDDFAGPPSPDRGAHAADDGPPATPGPGLPDAASTPAAPAPAAAAPDEPAAALDEAVFDLSAFDDPAADEPLVVPSTRAAEPAAEREAPPAAAPTPAPVSAAAAAPAGAAPAALQPAVDTVDALRARVRAAESDWELRRRLAEALFEAGDRDGGLQELERAMIGYEHAGDLDGAGSVVDEIVRVQPNSVRHHQKRVEYAVRGGDKPRLADAYVQLADALFRGGQTEMARAVYHRVLDLVPDDVRARAALTAFLDTPATAPAAQPKPAARPAVAPPARAAAPAEPAPVAPPRPAPMQPPPLAEGEFVDLGEWLRADEPVKSTRMRIDEQAPTGDEQADFNEMLKKFKAGVAENVDADDHESHYDLGVAFKEMGLLDEAIAEFQKALRAPDRRARTYEALGQCFMEKQQLPVALTILQRALGEPGVGDDQLVGVLYLLGYASEALQRRDDAVAYYQRVFAVDIQFRDVGDRLNALEKVAR